MFTIKDAMSDPGVPLKKLGVWISDKKSQKLNWSEFRAACLTAGYELIKLDVERGVEEQGALNVFLHKLTDLLALADTHDPKATDIIKRVEQYLSNHPEITVIDPFDRVRILLNRNRYYRILEEEPSFRSRGIFTPAFVDLTDDNHDRNVEILASRGVTFPLVCKPRVAHGSRAHRMTLLCNARGLAACRAPAVLQSFVNHDALLYKVYVVGNRYHISERPSLKNFYHSEDCEPIHFNTGDVCKADSQSTLSILDPHDRPRAYARTSLDEDRIKHIIRILRKKIGLLLYGFDVVIDNVTGNHAVIDINVFPSYDSFPDFFDHLLAEVSMLVESNRRGQIEDCGFAQCNGLVNVGAGCVRMNMWTGSV